jgi:acetyl-CoA acetyltransferase
MSEAVIISTARTPIGRARKGTLARMDAFQLAEVAVLTVAGSLGQFHPGCTGVSAVPQCRR